MELVTKKKLLLYSGSAHPELAAEIADHLEVDLGDANLRTFANGRVAKPVGDWITGRIVRCSVRHTAEAGAARLTSQSRHHL